MRKTKKQKPLHGGSQTQEDLDTLSQLIFNKTPYSEFRGGGLNINPVFDKFFQIQGRVFQSTAATEYLNTIINEYNSRGQTLLYVACAFGTLDMIEILLTCSNINVNHANKTEITNRSTPFIGCCYKRNNLSEIKKIFKMFLSREMKVPRFNFAIFTDSILNTRNKRNESANTFLTKNAVELINNFLLNLN